MDNNEIEIKVTADVSDLEKSIDSATKKVDKQADKMEKSFNDLSKSLDKVKANMNNAFKGNNTNLNGLTNQLNKLTNVATNVASKVQSALKKAFNVEGKVTVKQDVQTTNTTTNANGNGGALADALLTGGTIGALMNKELAQMNRNITSSIPKSFKEAIDKSEGMFSKMGASIQKTFKNMANTISSGTIGKVEQYNKLSENLGYLQKKMNLTKKSFNSLIDGFKRGMINAKELSNGLLITKNSLERLQKESEAKGLGLDFNKSISSLSSVRKEIGRIQDAFNNGEIDSSTMVGQIMGLKSKVKSQLILVQNEVRNHMDGISRALASIDQKSFGYRVGKQLLNVGNQAQVAFNKIQVSVNKLKAKLADTTIGRGLVHINTTIKGKVIPAFQVLQGRCKQLMTSFKNIGNSAKKMGSDTKRATSMMKSGFASLISMLAPFLSIFAIFNGLKNSITSYVDSLSNGTKFATVFKGETQQMAKWVDELNSRVTMGKNEIMDFSSNLYRMGLNMGVAKDDAMSMSQSMTELGADLKAFTGDANAIEALAGALRGEYDSIQNYGYALDASSVKAKALAMGLDDASESSLLLARQTLLLEQSGDVLGYTARNSQSLAVQLAFLKKNFIELGNSIGACFGGLLTIVLPVLNRIVQAVTSAFNKIASVINQVLGIFGIKVGGSGGGGGTGLVNQALGSISDGIGGIGDSLGGASGGAGKLADGLKEGASNAKEMAKELKGLMGMDEINNLSADKGDSGSGSGGSGSGSGGSGGGSGSGGSGGGIGDGGGINSALTVDDSVVSETETKVSALAQKIANALRFIGENFMIGWNSTIGYIEQANEKLKANFQHLGEAIEGFLVGFAQNGGDLLIQSIGRLSGSLVGLATNILGSVVGVVAGVIEHLNPANNNITKGFIDALTGLNNAISDFAQSFSSWFDKIIDGGLGHFINVCGDVIVLIGTLLVEAFSWCIQAVTDFFNSWIGQAILDGVAGALDLIATAVEWLANVINENREIIYGIFIGLGVVIGGAFVVANAGIIAIIAVISALVVAVGWLWNNWDTVVKWCSDALVNFSKTCKEKWQNVTDTIIAFCGKIKDKAIELWDKMITNIKKFLDDICKKATNIWEQIKSTISNVMKSISTTVSNIWNNIKSAITNTMNNIKTTISNIWNNIKNAISTVISTISSSISTAWNNVKSTTSTVFNGIKSTISTIMDGVKTAIKIAITFIKALFTGDLSTCKNIVSGVFEGIKSKITSIMEGVKSKIKGVIDTIKGFFNFSVRMPHIPLPHFSITPKGWKIGDLLQGVRPNLGISWYSQGKRKYCSDSNKPTKIGRNVFQLIQFNSKNKNNSISRIILEHTRIKMN